MITFVLEHEAAPERRRIFRRRRTPEPRVCGAVRFGVRALEVSVPLCGEAERDGASLDAAAELLLGYGVREAVSATERLRKGLGERGVFPPRRSGLERAMLTRTALEAVRLLGAQSAAVVARRRSRELDDAVRRLSEKVRSLAVILPGENGEYIRSLRRSVGLPVRTDGAALASAEVKLLFAEPEMPLGKGAAVGYVPRAEAGLEVAESLRYIFPPEIAGSIYPPEDAAAALLKAGALRAEDIAIKELRFSNSIDILRFSHYNAIWNAEKREAEGRTRPLNRKAGSL